MSISNLLVPNDLNLFAGSITANVVNATQNYAIFTIPGNINVPTGFTNVVDWSGFEEGNASLLDNTSAPGFSRIRDAGIYIVSFVIQLNADSNSEGKFRTIQVLSNGATSLVPQNGSNPTYSICQVVKYNADESFGILFQTDATTTRQVVAGFATAVTIVKIA